MTNPTDLYKETQELMETEQSEFGRGFAYCIGLFLAHAERKQVELDGRTDYGLWFNSAADHLFELEIPENFSLHEECKNWQKLCLDWSLSLQCSKPDKEDFKYAIDSAKKFLLEWDKQCGISATKGDWE